MRGMFLSSSVFRMTCSAGIFFSSASATTTARSTPASTALGLEGELDRARAVEEGDAVAHEIGLGDVHLDAHLMGARFGRGVADRVLLGDRPLPGDRAGPRQDRFEKGCLAACERAHQRDAPWARYSAIAVSHGVPLPGSGSVPRCERVRPRAVGSNRLRERSR